MSGGLEGVKADLRKHAEEKSARELEQGDAEGQRIVEQARAQAKQVLERFEQEARLQAAEESLRVSAARLRAGKIVAEAREKCIASTISEMMGLLASGASPRNASNSGYEKLFAKLARQALKQVEGGVIRCRKQDAPLARKAGRVGEPIDCSGGLVIESADGRVRLDGTFEGLLEEHKDELNKKAFELLFEK